jgi:hypothetical protein
VPTANGRASAASGRLAETHGRVLETNERVTAASGRAAAANRPVYATITASRDTRSHRPRTSRGRLNPAALEWRTAFP